MLERMLDRRFNEVDDKLDRVLWNQRLLLSLIGGMEREEMADLTALTAQVAATVGVEQSAITLIQGIAAQLAAAQTDPVAVANLAAQLKASSDALAAAITANSTGTTPSAQSASSPAAPTSAT
jgi:hypothetical protein